MTAHIISRPSGLLEPAFPSSEWARWADRMNAIQRQLLDLATKRQIHRAHRQVLWQVEDLEGRRIEDGTVIVHHWMQENYADSMLIGLRKVVDRTRGTLSLIRLVEQIESGRPLVTFERYVQLWGTESRQENKDLQELLFSQFSSDGRTLDRDRIRADIKFLLAEHDSILGYINSAIAHHSERVASGLKGGPSPELTWEDLDRLLDDIAGLFNKYHALVKPGVHIDFESILPAGYDQALRRMVP